MFGKMWKAFLAQVNKLANFFWQADPIAQMQLEYDNAVEQLKEGRRGLEQYRALVERVTRQVKNNEHREQELTAQVKAYLKTGDRESAGKFAVELKSIQAELAENRSQLELHEKSYDNNVKKIKRATEKLSDVRAKIQKYDAELKMSEAEAEVAQLAQNFNFDVTTDFGELETVINERIDLNHAKTRVAADLSEEGIAEIEAEERMQKAMADDLLTQFEVEMGLKTSDTAGVKEEAKSIGAENEPTAEQKESALGEFEKEIGS
ncbi:MAG: PspA/IM30 family protein [Planctomycetes bacterium]|nr:PspA/IM30 family protein [Planctomycetota bacterium]